MAVNAQVEQRLDTLVDNFDHYVAVHDRTTPLVTSQLATHRRTIALRNKAGSVVAAVHDEKFLSSLRETLQAWGIGVRASILLPPQDFAESLRSVSAELIALEACVIGSDDVAEPIMRIIESLRIVGNQAKLVASTKVLHHLLPELVPPMDRVWTGWFFQAGQQKWQSPPHQRQNFLDMYQSLATVATKTDPQHHVTGEGWRTNRTKILDNALIGYCKAELVGNRSDSYR